MSVEKIAERLRVIALELRASNPTLAYELALLSDQLIEPKLPSCGKADCRLAVYEWHDEVCPNRKDLP